MSSDPLVHALFSCNSSWCVTPPPGRKTNSARDGGIPSTTEGLRILAAEGSWAEVLELAANLEREMLQTAPRVAVTSSSSSNAPLTSSSSRGGSSNQQQQQQKQTVPQYDGATLQLVLARVTAYIKMADFHRAHQLLENVPWSHVAENEVPFSLVFLRCFVPMLLPQANAADFARVQSRLYALLGQIDSQLVAAMQQESGGAALLCCAETQHKQQRAAAAADDVPTSLLEHRRFRVTRAIVANHVRLQETSSAIDMLQRLAEYHAERRHRVQQAVADVLQKNKKKQKEAAATAEEEEAAKSRKQALQTIVYENVFLTSPAVTKDRTGFSGGSSTASLAGTSADLSATSGGESPTASMLFTNAGTYSSSPPPNASLVPPAATTKSTATAAAALTVYERQQMQKMVDVATMEEMLCLQQAMCLSLYSGNAPLSHQLRKSAEAVLANHLRSTPSSSDDDDDFRGGGGFGPEPWHLKDLMMCLNDSLLDVFFDRPQDAAARLSAVVGGFLIDAAPSSATSSANVVLPQLAAPLAKPSQHVIAAQHKALPVGTGGSSSSGDQDGRTQLHLKLPFYLASGRSLHVQYQFLSICLTLISLVPHVLHAPPTASSQRAPASVESKRPQTAADTAALCNAALDRLVTCYPAIALRMPGVVSLISEVRTAMAGDMASARRILYQTVLAHLVAGRESVSNLN